MTNTNTNTIKLRKYQRLHVDEVIEAIGSIERARIHNANNMDQTRISIESPTGSGKTVMISFIVDERLRDYAVLLLSPGQGHLEKQTKDKLMGYLQGKPTNAVMLNQSVMSTPLKPGTIYVSNWEKLIKRDKEGNLSNTLTRVSEIGNLEQSIVNTVKSGTRVAIIIDESHYGKGNKSKKEGRIVALLDDIQHWVVDAGGDNPIIIEASATPINRLGHSPARSIKIEYSEVKEAQLMRKSIIRNDDDKGGLTVSTVHDGDEKQLESTENILLTAAYNRLEDLDTLYAAANSDYHALLAVVIPNSDAGNEATKRIDEFFASKGITVGNHQLVHYSNDTKDVDNVQSLADADSPARVLVYKQALSMGWDCPRAQILVGFRHIKSIIFSKQNIGRFLRTTEHRYYDETDPDIDRLNYTYVYDNSDDNDIMNDPDTIATESGMMDSFLPLNPAAREFVDDLNAHRLPKSYVNRGKQASMSGKDLNGILTKAYDNHHDELKDIIEVRESLVSGTINTEDLDMDTASFSTHGNTVSALVSDGVMDARLKNEISQRILVHVSAIPDKERQASNIIHQLASLVRRDDLYPDADDDVKAKNLLLGNLETMITIVDEALQSVVSKDEIGKDDELEDGIVVADPKDTKSIEFAKAWHLGENIPVPSAARVVGSKLVPTALYQKSAGGSGATAYYTEPGERSQPERNFEDSLLRLSDDSDQRFEMAFWMKNPTKSSQDESLSLGIHVAYHFNDTDDQGKVVHKVAGWYPDYLLGIKDNTDGHVFPVVIEIKGAWKQDYHGRESAASIGAKAKSGEQYMEHTGIPVGLFHDTGHGFLLHDFVNDSGYGQSFVEFLKAHANNTIKDFNADDDVTWMKHLGFEE